MGNLAAQLIQNGETVGVDIGPIIHAAARKPFGLAQGFKTITRAKKIRLSGLDGKAR